MAEKLIFVVMPWHSVHYPSLAAGILTNLLNDRPRADYETETVYANISWAEFLAAKTDGRLGAQSFNLLGEDLFFKGTGEWIFSSALYQCKEWRVEEYRSFFGDDLHNFDIALTAHRLAYAFVDQLADEIIASGATMIGFTSVFQQNTACLALARLLKERAPEIVTLMGGANCDGVQGEAVHRNFHFLDYVFSGESDYAFPAFLDMLAGLKTVDQVPGLCWRDDDGKTVANPHGKLPQASDFRIPHHDDYFEQALNSSQGHYIEPNIVAESARGCWWGQKHHCTFCGLNGMGMAFRSKDPDAFIAELEYLLRRHQTLDVIVTDNIIDMKYITTVLPTIRRHGWDLRLHYEIKANLHREQLKALQDAGVWHIQPGIESLSTHILGLMDKGTTGARNVQLLRDCEELNLTTTWNLLCGFPGETEENYRNMEAQMPALVHLQPPSGAARLAVERFSPYFNNPSLGFSDLRPAACYRVIYDLPETELMDLVYVFEVQKAGIDDTIICEMQTAIDRWRDAYDGGSTLKRWREGDQILIEDRRIGWPQRDHLIEDPLSICLLELLDRPVQLSALVAEARKLIPDIEEAAVHEQLAAFRSDGLLYEDDGLYVGLVTAHIPFRLRLAA